MSGKVSIIDFPNKFRLVHQRPAHKLPISHIHLFVHVGSANEDAKTRGASHFIEHMCFKGTKKHPNTKDITRNFDNQGAYFNAHTVKQYTCYDIKCTDEDMPRLIRVLADAMFNSVFDKREYKKELAVVIEENIRDEVDYERMTLNLLESAVFEGSVFEHPIDTMRYHKTTDTLKYDDVLEFYHKFYLPSNMLLSITTNIPIGNITRFMRQTEFARSSACLHPVAGSYAVLRPTHEPRISVTRVPRMESVNLAIGFSVCSFMHDDAIVLHVLENILGGRMSSRVFTILREDNGLTYSSDVNTLHYEPGGVFYVFAISDSNKLIRASSKNKGVIPLLVDMLCDLYKNGVTREEWTNTRRYLEKKVQMEIEDVDSLSYMNGKRVLLRNLKTITPYQDMYHAYYEKVTMADIHRVIRTYFTKDRAYLAMVGGRLPAESELKRWLDRLP